MKLTLLAAPAAAAALLAAPAAVAQTMDAPAHQHRYAEAGPSNTIEMPPMADYTRPFPSQTDGVLLMRSLTLVDPLTGLSATKRIISNTPVPNPHPRWGSDDTRRVMENNDGTMQVASR